jgi:hypothetical protein
MNLMMMRRRVLKLTRMHFRIWMRNAVTKRMSSMKRKWSQMSFTPLTRGLLLKWLLRMFLAKNGVDALGQLTTGDDNDENNDANDSNKVEYVGSPPQEGIACQLTYDSPTAVVQAVGENRMTTYPETFHSSEFSTLTVQQAWDRGSIARPQTSLGN